MFLINLNNEYNYKVSLLIMYKLYVHSIYVKNKVKIFSRTY